MAAPTKYTEKLAKEICEHIANGGGLRRFCADKDDLAVRTVYYWLMDEERVEFLHMYERAREQQQEHWADEIVEIADDGSNDWTERETKAGNIITVVDHDHINRSRLRVDTRKWLMSKLAPRKYGESKRIESDVTVHVKRIILEEASE